MSNEDAYNDPGFRAANHLIGRQDSADWELDLRGLDLAHACASIDRMVERNRFGEAKSVTIRLDPATPESGETLFLPIGRYLLELMRRELVLRFNPLSTDKGAGFLVELPGRSEAQHPEHEDTPVTEPTDPDSHEPTGA
ncbi:hypothetical protein [Fodinicurvata sediminis]|uniref:hypothetical protein n=1 Tax=Fodinicurvata sediminis TaxID=1121832 RepID=UPI0003B5A80D|nr:hypothetical protein [Fodinicurvata sediminis]